MNGPRRGGQRQSNPNEIGAAWIKQSQRDGTEYISIQLKPEAANFDLANCFIDMYYNENKRSDKAPDYRIIAKPKQQQQQRQAPQQPQRQQMPRPGAPQRQVQNHAPQSTGWDDEDPGY